MSHRLFSLVCRLLGGEKSTLREAKAIPLVVGWTLASKFSSSSNSSSSSGGGRNCRPLVWGDKSYGRRERSGRTSLLPNRSARCKIMASDDVDRLAEELEDRAAVSSSRGSRGGRFRGGRGGRGGGGKGREVDLSRALSRLLRHQAESAGVTLDAQGFAPLDKVLQWGPIRSLQPSFAEIQAAVHNSDKQRFAIKPNPSTNPSLDESSTDPAQWLIRANQGHSIKLDNEGLLRPLALDPVPDVSVGIPTTVVHGTYFAFWSRIVASGGLRPMGRNHVHFSTGLPEDEAGVISGMRRDAELLVYVDVEASIREGAQWWISDNGVVLTEGVPDENGPVVDVKFFKKVLGRTQDVGVLWSDGEWVADLPEGIKIRMPQGKGRAGGSGRGGRGGGRGRGGRT